MDVSRDEIAKLVQQACKLKEINTEQYGKPLKSIGIDSLDIASVFLAVMERYGLDVPDEEIDRLNTIDAIAAYIESRQV
jgi:acyl carrier protein